MEYMWREANDSFWKPWTWHRQNAHTTVATPAPLNMIHFSLCWVLLARAELTFPSLSLPVEFLVSPVVINSSDPCVHGAEELILWFLCKVGWMPLMPSPSAFYIGIQMWRRLEIPIVSQIWSGGSWKGSSSGSRFTSIVENPTSVSGLFLCQWNSPICIE